MNQLELAARFFNTIVGETGFVDQFEIKLASIRCLEVIHAQVSTINFSEDTLKKMGGLISTASINPKNKNILAEAAFQIFVSNLKKGAAGAELKPTLDLLKNFETHEQYANALVAMQGTNPQSAVPILEGLEATRNFPPDLVEHKNELRLMLGRLYYENKDYPKAISILQKVDKSSNQLGAALSDLSWSLLRLRDFPRAVGIAVSLQSGSLRRTFTPESLMVASMALNELCLYPESLHVVETFKRKYKSSHDWLQTFNHMPDGRKEPLYRYAAAFLKQKPMASMPPDLVVVEWIRSPVFISRQQALNLLARNEREIPVIFAQSDQFLREALAKAQKLELAEAEKKRDLASSGKGADDPDYRDKQAEAHRARTQFRMMRAAYTELKKNLTEYGQEIPKLRQLYLTQIEADFRKTNAILDNELNKVFDNSELIEAEIWNGASQDLVWKNAHPDYAEFSKKEVLPRTLAKLNEGPYNWQLDSSNFISTDEVWDDEIGHLAASLHDNCANKERYLKLKKKRKRKK